MHAPAFWQRDGALPLLLAPLASAYAAATARRVARPGWRAPVPVLCCGNAGIGGAGKTTLALDLGRRLRLRGVAVAFISRGYGGSATGTLHVDPALHDAGQVGDEALLLAALSPTFIGRDRAAGARAAVAAGARLLIMDDGLQNPSLIKDFSILVIDGAVGFGNGRTIPAGPLREPVATAASRCRAAVLIGDDRTGAAATLPADLKLLRAGLRSVGNLSGRRVLAFAGIGRPEKFFESLREAGAQLVATRAFPDHHRYSEREIRPLLDQAARLGAACVTTPKDAVRLPRALRGAVAEIGVEVIWESDAAIEALLDSVPP